MPKSKRNFVEVKTVPEINGYITVAKAVGMVNAASVYRDESGGLKEALQSTINYWLRTGLIEGVRLDSGKDEKGKPVTVVLINRKSLLAYLDELPKVYARRAEAERKRNQKASLEDELKKQRARIEEEYRAKIAALDSEQEPPTS